MTKNRFRSNILLLLTVTGLSFIGAECLVRYLFSEATLSNRFLMWSSPPYVLETNNAIHYVTNSQLREIAVYGKTIEYDVRFPVNDLGYVDTENYLQNPAITSSKKRLAFVGDSFTVGSGATPWIPRLREQLRKQGNDLYIFNLGLAGGSTEHFLYNLEHFSNLLPIDEIVILAISNDFHRLYWRPMQNNAVRICPDGESDEVCSNRIPFAEIINYEITEKELQERIDQHWVRWHERIVNNRLSTHPLALLFSYSRLSSLVIQLLEKQPIFAVGERNQKIGRPIIRYAEERSFEALEKIGNRFPNTKIRFIHLPEKEEVRTKQYNLEIQSRIKEMGFDYFPALNECPWTPEMFYTMDNHPNEQGYENLMKCVEKYLFSSQL